MTGLLRTLAVAYVALLPYQLRAGDHLNFAPADCFLILIILIAPGALCYRRRAWTIWHLGIVMTVCVGALVSSMRFGEIQRYELVNKCAGLSLPLLSYAAITSCALTWFDIRRILRAFVFGVVVENTAAVGLFIGAYFFGISNPLAQYGGMRLSGTLLDPNAYGGLLVAAFVICEGASYGPSPLISGLPLWIARASLILGILFTFSRSAWAALGVALLVLGAVRARTAARVLVSALAAAPCLFLLMGPRFVTIFQTMASRPKQVQGRFDLIHSALADFAAHPLLGGGLGSFRLGEREIAHNTAMWFLADFGIIGLLALMTFVGWFFVRAWQTYRSAPPREQPIALAMLVAHAAMLGLAMGIEAFYQRAWWMILGLIAAGSCLTRPRPVTVLEDC
jgi:O-antigen ligase